MFIPKPEVAWIRGHRHRMLLQSRDHGDESEDAVGRSYLEIKLRGDDTSELADRLRAER